MNNESAGRHLCMDDVDENEMHVWLESGYGGCWTLVWEKDGAQRDGIAAKVPASQLGYGTYSVVMAGKFVNGDYFRTKRQLFIRLVDREDQADAEPTMYNEEQAYWAGPAVLSEMLSRDGLNTYELWILQGNEGTMEQFLAFHGFTLNDYMVHWNHLSVDVQTKIQRGEEKGIEVMGDYSATTTYDVNDLVFDPTTNSSYISKHASNTGNALTDTDHWMKTMDGSDVLRAIEDADDATDAANTAAATAESAAAGAVTTITEALTGYFTCGASADKGGLQTKVVDNDHDYIKPSYGGAMKIRMYQVNTYVPTTGNPVKLKIGSETAAELLYNREPVTPNNSWEENEVISVYYDGSVYQASNAQGSVKKDDVPTKFSDNVVKSGGLYDTIEEELYEKTLNTEKINSSTFTFTQGVQIYYNNGQLNTSAGSGWYSTVDYIEINNWYSIYTTAGGAAGGAAVAFYRADKSYISGAPCGTNATVQVPSNAAYARFCKSGGTHVITTYSLINKINSIKSDLESNYQKKTIEVDYLPSVTTGTAYVSSGIGNTIAVATHSSFYSAKIPCKKGDMFGIIASGFQNAWPAIITDANNKVLWASGYAQAKFGGILEIAQDNAAYLYVSSYNNPIQRLTKLAFTPGDTITVDSSYAQAAMLNSNNGLGTYNNYVGISIPMLMQKGDVVKIKFRGTAIYRGYLLRNAAGSIIGSLSDEDLNAETLFCWNGDEDVYLYVNGQSSNPPYIIKYAKNAAIAMKNHGMKMAAMGDSITSYGASDVGELVRGHIGMSFLRTSTQIDWGNIAEGQATICNWSNTTETLIHNSSPVDGVYVNRTLPNQVLQLLRHVTAEGSQISWHINSDNSNHSIDTTVATGGGYTTDIPDLIYIGMGTNDSVTTDDFNTVIGQTYSQLTKLTICSALRWSLETLQNVFPKAVIVCVTPFKRGTRTTAEQEAKCNLIKKMCNYMAIPVVDGYIISGYSPLSYGLYSSDQIHPNTNTQRVVRSIAAQVDALI